MENKKVSIFSRVRAALESHAVRRGLTALGAFAVILALAMSARGCREYKERLAVNTMALTDTVSYYKSKSGLLVAKKAMLERDMDALRRANDSLYNIIKDIKVKNPDNAARIVTVIENSASDTCWIVRRDTVHNNKQYNITRVFDFSDEWRSLSGYTYYRNDTLGTAITRDAMRADFTVVQKNNNIYVVSNNPRIKYESITAITSKKSKKWHIGPFVGVGVTHKLEPRVFVGVGMQYSLFSF